MANSINDSGQTVGSSTTLPGEDHAFLWEDGKIYDLNNMIDSSEGWILIDATDINNHGQIIGYGTHNGTITSFILTPIPYYINDGEIQLEESILALQVLTNVKKVHVSLDADVNNDG